ncbi:MAG: hypothetical protein UR26_C0007G0024 [candidate division TM6 bacterium GW2011_GWF2_32_72]|nr:MAG: hypothetical protein UR26_C0007G0024 [candidate division TM6 bacterium GW2011_GWF2_32_72]
MKRILGLFFLCSMVFVVSAKTPKAKKSFSGPTRVDLTNLENTFEKVDGIPLTLVTGANAISSSGVYYIDDSKADADITISADNVVLDLRGRLVQSITVAGNFVKVLNGSVAYASNTAISATGFHDIVFENLFVENSGGTGTTYAVTFSMCSNVVYSNANMYGDAAQLLFDTCKSIDVRDLQILGSGAGSFDYCASMSLCSNISCRNISISNQAPTYSPLYTFSSKNFVMEDIIISQCSNGANIGSIDLFSCSGGAMHNCSVEPTTNGYGVRLYNCLATSLDSCSVIGAAQSGFTFAGDTSSVLVTNCLAARNSLMGFAISVNGTVDLYNCISSNNTLDGIRIDGGSKISIDNCSCIDNAGNGITMEDSLVLDCTVENSLVTGNSGHGILVQDNGGGIPKQGAIINNYVASNTGEGIYLRSAGIFRFTVADNKCIGNTVGVEQDAGSTGSNAIFNNVALANSVNNYVNVSGTNICTLANLNAGTQTAWMNIQN